MSNQSVTARVRRRGLMPASAGACFLFAILAGAPADAREGTSNCQINDGAVGKTIAGLECQMDELDRYEDWGYNSAGQICNYSENQDLLVHCPLLRTELTSKEGLSCAIATLVYWDDAVIDKPKPGCNLHGQGYGEKNSPWKCIIQSKDETGLYGWWYGMIEAGGGLPKEMKSIGIPGAWKIEWAANIFHSYYASIAEFSGGSYYLSCELPATTPQSNGQCGGSTCLSSLRWFERPGPK